MQRAGASTLTSLSEFIGYIPSALSKAIKDVVYSEDIKNKLLHLFHKEEIENVFKYQKSAQFINIFYNGLINVYRGCSHIKKIQAENQGGFNQFKELFQNYFVNKRTNLLATANGGVTNGIAAAIIALHLYFSRLNENLDSNTALERAILFTSCFDDDDNFISIIAQLAVIITVRFQNILTKLTLDSADEFSKFLAEMIVEVILGKNNLIRGEEEIKIYKILQYMMRDYNNIIYADAADYQTITNILRRITKQPRYRTIQVQGDEKNTSYEIRNIIFRTPIKLHDDLYHNKTHHDSSLQDMVQYLPKIYEDIVKQTHSFHQKIGISRSPQGDDNQLLNTAILAEKSLEPWNLQGSTERSLRKSSIEGLSYQSVPSDGLSLQPGYVARDVLRVNEFRRLSLEEGCNNKGFSSFSPGTAERGNNQLLNTPIGTTPEKEIEEYLTHSVKSAGEAIMKKGGIELRLKHFDIILPNDIKDIKKYSPTIFERSFQSPAPLMGGLAAGALGVTVVAGLAIPAACVCLLTGSWFIYSFFQANFCTEKFHVILDVYQQLDNMNLSEIRNEGFKLLTMELKRLLNRLEENDDIAHRVHSINKENNINSDRRYWETRSDFKAGQITFVLRSESLRLMSGQPNEVLINKFEPNELCLYLIDNGALSYVVKNKKNIVCRGEICPGNGKDNLPQEDINQLKDLLRFDNLCNKRLYLHDAALSQHNELLSRLFSITSNRGHTKKCWDIWHKNALGKVSCYQFESEGNAVTQVFYNIPALSKLLNDFLDSKKKIELDKLYSQKIERLIYDLNYFPDFFPSFKLSYTKSFSRLPLFTLSTDMEYAYTYLFLGESICQNREGDYSTWYEEALRYAKLMGDEELQYKILIRWVKALCSFSTGSNNDKKSLDRNAKLLKDTYKEGCKPLIESLSSFSRIICAEVKNFYDPAGNRNAPIILLSKEMHYFMTMQDLNFMRQFLEEDKVYIIVAVYYAQAMYLKLCHDQKISISKHIQQQVLFAAGIKKEHSGFERYSASQLIFFKLEQCWKAIIELEATIQSKGKNSCERMLQYIKSQINYLYLMNKDPQTKEEIKKRLFKREDSLEPLLTNLEDSKGTLSCSTLMKTLVRDAEDSNLVSSMNLRTADEEEENLRRCLLFITKYSSLLEACEKGEIACEYGTYDHNEKSHISLKTNLDAWKNSNKNFGCFVEVSSALKRGKIHFRLDEGYFLEINPAFDDSDLRTLEGNVLDEKTKIILHYLQDYCRRTMDISLFGGRNWLHYLVCLERKADLEELIKNAVRDLCELDLHEKEDLIGKKAINYLHNSDPYGIKVLLEPKVDPKKQMNQMLTNAKERYPRGNFSLSISFPIELSTDKCEALSNELMKIYEEQDKISRVGSYKYLVPLFIKIQGQPKKWEFLLITCKREQKQEQGQQKITRSYEYNYLVSSNSSCFDLVFSSLKKANPSIGKDDVWITNTLNSIDDTIKQVYEWVGFDKTTVGIAASVGINSKRTTPIPLHLLTPNQNTALQPQ